MEEQIKGRLRASLAKDKKEGFLLNRALGKG